MQIRLAENIRALRRQHRFTQEQLAESLGVTPGASISGRREFPIVKDTFTPTAQNPRLQSLFAEN